MDSQQQHLTLNHRAQRAYDLLFVLTQKELRVRYKSYALGYLWSLLNPIFQCVLFYFVFGLVMKNRTPNYLSFLISGIFAWQWVGNSLGTAPWNFLGNASLIKKVPFPRFLLVLVNNLQDLIHFIMSLPIIIGVLLFQGASLSTNLALGLPILLVLQLLLLFSISLVISTLNLFLRDLERVVSLILMAIFYGTPIVYQESAVPIQFQWILSINPFAQLIISWRHLFLAGIIDWDSIGVLCLQVLPLLVISSFMYYKLQSRFAEVI